MKDFVRGNFARVLLLVLMIAYAVYFSALSIQRHNTFRTSAADLGQMDQALWNTLHGHLLEDTRDNKDGTGVYQAPRLTDHVEPIFIPLSLSYLVYDGVQAILVVQSIAVALGALAVFWIAERRLKSELAGVAFAAMYLLFPALEAANLAEFHAVTFAPAPLLFAYNYTEERAWKRFAAFAFIALMVKEEIALLVFVMAVWAMLTAVPSPGKKAEGRHASSPSVRVRRLTFYVSRFTSSVPRVPLAVAILSLLWFVLAVLVIIPHFSVTAQSPYVTRYDNSPLAVITGLFIPEKLAYLAQLLASSGLIALFDPLSLALGAPSLILNLLSKYPAQYSGTYHYSAPVAPYFVLAAIGGTARLSEFIAARRVKFPISNLQLPLTNLQIPVAAFVLAVALAYHAIAGYTPIGGQFFWPTETPHQQLLGHFLEQIPPDVPVSTTKTLFPHLSHRRFLYRFPTTLDAQFILLDVSQMATTNPVDFVLNYRAALDQGYGVRDALDGYILLERGLTQKELPDRFYNFLRACACALPQNRVVIDFEDKIRFLGYDVQQDDWGRVYLRTYWTRLPGLEANNYTPFPFFADAAGAPNPDLPLPDLLVQFWYPSIRWQDGEVIVADTTPIEIGARANLGVGMFFGATWNDNVRRLTPHTDAPVTAQGAVFLGELVRDGKGYRVIR